MLIPEWLATGREQFLTPTFAKLALKLIINKFYSNSVNIEIYSIRLLI